MKEKKFKIFRSKSGRTIYRWTLECPKCKKIWEIDLEKSRWCIEASGLTISCECGFDCVVGSKDLEIACITDSIESNRNAKDVM
ncbi:hypothetical protein A2Z67_04760 [Candidatus Woesebacteria bacterium RBG_13_36_22]|uniref:Uncharacterized protein n=1 Tax=Candidatus Woesebacteria bacterium RBG_13_36_22 TaxID=1802478 RepID=A0A1F7X2M4_9BACT|nr:MAG: hypothetical protein A2Z67_04760 [Candidatus Woesebacteria bacterium RBG_13_36_22]